MVDADLLPMSMLTALSTINTLTDGSPVADVSDLVDGDLLAERGVPEAVMHPEGR